MTSRGIEDKRSITATARIGLEAARERSPAAAQLLALCSFLTADDIPRALLFRGAKALPADARAPFASAAALLEPLEALSRYSLMRSRGDALTIHRTTQAAVRDDLPPHEREKWATGAAQMVLSVFPQRPEDSRESVWAGRVRPHAITTADHLDGMGLEPKLAIQLRTRAARYLASQGQFQSALKLLRRAIDQSERTEGQGGLYATALNQLAGVERELGMFTNARRNARRALEIHSATARPSGEHIRRGASNANADVAEQTKMAAEDELFNDPEIAEDLTNLGRIARHRGEFPEALEYLTQGLRMRTQLHGPEHAAVADSYAELFDVLMAMRNKDDAISALRTAAEVGAAAHGEDDDEVAIQNDLLSIMTDPGTAVERSKDVLARSESIYSDRHPSTAQASELVASVLRHTGQFDEARAMARRALDVYRAVYGDRHFRVGSALVELTMIETAAGDIVGAEQTLRQALQIVLTVPKEDIAPTLRLIGLDYALTEAATVDHARPLISRARDLLEEMFVDDKHALTVARQDVLHAYLAAGDRELAANNPEGAKGHYDNGMRTAMLTVENPLDDASAHVRLGVVAARASNASEAIERLRAAVVCLTEGGFASPVWAVVAECSTLYAAFGRPQVLQSAVARLVAEALKGGAMPQFRAAITTPVPDGWFTKESTTLLAPDGQANVLASSEPLDASIDTNQYASAQSDLLAREFPEYLEKSFEAGPVFGNREGYLREFEWSPPDGPRVTQLQLYYAEAGRGYTATATTPTEGYPERELLLRQTLMALRIVD